MKIFRSITINSETFEVLHEDSYQCESVAVRCDRSVQKASGNAAKTAGSTGANLGSQASQISGSLVPGLEREATNPTGFSPTDLNNMTVAGAEGVGGANSGIAGQANLTAARTRNAGGFGAALDEASRNKGRQLSSNALGVQNQNAEEKLKQQKFAQGELGNLYGTDTSSMLKAMGLQNEDLNTQLHAGQSGWMQQFQQIMQSLGGADATGAKIATGTP